MDDLKKPILPGKGASDYERYLRTDELLSLQKLPEEFLHKDEMTFQVVHQASELLLKGVAWELGRARTHIEAGDFANAARLIRRANHMLDYPISMLHVLETITPYDYHIIRAGLGHGSGLDSPGFLSMLHVGPRLGEVFHASYARRISAWMTFTDGMMNSLACTMWRNACWISTNAYTSSAFIISSWRRGSLEAA